MIGTLLKTTCVGLAASLTLMTASTAHAGDARQLLYANYQPPTNAANQFGYGPYFDAVTKATNNELTFDLVTGGALLGAKAMLPGLRDGLADGGFVVTLYTPSDLPRDSMLSEMALIGENSAVMAAAVAETVLLDCPDCLADWDKNGVAYVAPYATMPYYLMCKGELKSSADIKGKKVRAVGAWGKWISELGGVPVNLPSSEVYQALERGQADCALGAIAWLKQLSLIEQVDTIVDIPMGTFHGGGYVVYSKSTWDKLSKDQRSALITNAPIAMSGEIFRGYLPESVESRQMAVDKGVTFLAPDDVLLEKLEAYKTNEAELVATIAEGRGVENAREIIATLIENKAKWEGLSAEFGDDPDKYEEVLLREIYSKVQP
ncbi:MAG: C4-dicarboxylate TRAP transporter substrate-binding protein [Rhodobacteraceae bacterium]|nr:C4-dicarboxylate TRAP transporter substrate-binding protein [Paracoccaceae bacterium]